MNAHSGKGTKNLPIATTFHLRTAAAHTPHNNSRIHSVLSNTKVIRTSLEPRVQRWSNPAMEPRLRRCDGRWRAGRTSCSSSSRRCTPKLRSWSKSSICTASQNERMGSRDLHLLHPSTSLWWQQGFGFRSCFGRTWSIGDWRLGGRTVTVTLNSDRLTVRTEMEMDRMVRVLRFPLDQKVGGKWL